MESLTRRAALICATLVFVGFASRVAAQQTAPDSPPQSVPPAPPPDLRSATEPTFAAPRHRWVDMGGYLTPAIRHTGSARSSLKRQAKASPARPKKARHANKPEGRSAKSMTKAELSHCKSLTRRQLQRSSKCQVALRGEQKPAAHKSRPPKALSKTEQRRCQKMTYQQLLRNADCADLLQRELETSKHTKHRSGGGKAAAKAAPAQDKRHQKTSRHRRS
jgi:hypothetical protein